MQSIINLLAILFLVLFSCCNNPTKETKISIAVAANMQFAMEDLTQKFTEKSGIKCELSISSSGKLTAQIKEGAPFDVFISADMKYPQAIFDAGLAHEQPKVYAKGKLVLWTISDSLTPEIKILNTTQIQHIAIANPATAPYGAAAMEVLKHYNLADSLNSKLVYGESISQTNQFITSKAAELGFTAKSVVLSPEMKGKGKWLEIDEKLYSDINQGIVIIKRDSTENSSSREFYNYLFSSEAGKILKDYGYLVP